MPNTPNKPPPGAPGHPATPPPPQRQTPPQQPQHPTPSHQPPGGAPQQPGQPRPGQPQSHQASSVTQQKPTDPSRDTPFSRDELPPSPLETHPPSEAEYGPNRPRPGDKDWVAGSPATDYEAEVTEKEAKARLAAGKVIYDEYGRPTDNPERAGSEGRDEAGRPAAPDRDTQARLRHEDESRRAAEAAGNLADAPREARDRDAPNRPAR